MTRPKLDRPERYEIRLSTDERETWEAAATAAGVPLATWIRIACRVFAGEQRQIPRAMRGRR